MGEMPAKYGSAHKRLRKRLAPQVAMGIVYCARCGELIDPGQPWDLGHDDSDRLRHWGPEHRRCNRSRRPPHPPVESPHSRAW
jgi:hypothetical protein